MKSNELKWNQEQLDMIESLYQYSVPNVKLYYPEPFIASPSYIHNDIWYMHILVYWYWLWFVFLFIIVFFFITFLCCIRWCNPRIEPRRETRGVSRSKCGDLITASIPVTWAISIIISETTDAIDYFDGFKTTELIIGIRAYQWGWEYYYPKDIDLNYNIKPTYSEFIGNSLKYESTPTLKNKQNNMLNVLKKTNNNSSSPLSLSILLPLDFNNSTIRSKALSNHNLKLDTSFSSITKYFKNNNSNIFQSLHLNSYLNIVQPILSENGFVNSFSFKSIKKFNLMSVKSSINFYKTMFDLKILKKILKLNNESLENHITFYDFLQKNKVVESTLIKSKFYELNFLGDKLSDKKNFNLLNIFFKNNFKNLKKIESFNDAYFVSFKNLFFKNFSNSFSKKFNKVSKLNSWENDFKFLNKNFNKKKFLNYNWSPNLSKFFIKKNNLKQKPISRFFNAYNLLPVYSNNPFFSLEKNSLYFLKKSNESFIENNESFGPSSSQVWSTFFLKKNSFNKLNSAFNLSSSSYNLFYPMFFHYNDYDFLNKDSLKILENDIWNSYSEDYSIDEFLDLKNSGKRDYKNNFNLINKNTSKIKSKQIALNLIGKPSNQDFLLSPYFDFFINTSGFNQLNLSFFKTNVLIDLFYQNSYNFFKSNNLNIFNKILVNSYLNFFKSIDFKIYINFYKIISNDLSSISQFNSLNGLNTFFGCHSTQNFKTNIRSSSAELNADYKSLQKVFKLRFDDLRSHVSPLNLSSSYIKTFDLVDSMPSLSSSVFKNKNIFLSNSSFFLSKINFFSEKTSYLNNLLNNYSYDFPFFTAQQSDQIRYIWFDWFSRWNKYEVQQASLSKLGLFGMPKFERTNDFNGPNPEFINSENYLARLIAIRKNYFNISKFSPILISRFSIFNKDNPFNSNLMDSFNNKIYFLRLSLFNKWFNFNIIESNFSIKFNNLRSGFNKNGKSFYKPYNSSNSLFENYSLLADILTKKEFLIKKIFILKNETPATNLSISGSMNSFFFKELLALYENQNTINNLFNCLHKDPLKSQYKPMRRGISNMIRIQASNMVSLPVETRIQVLASSRDIIHSWAIPSAGVKIDCIPGYSSHRIIFFLLSGIYWGQCMEICGRYHHWMPIIVYFIKKDIFFLWCTHFVLSNKQNYINSYAYSDNFYKNKPIFIDKKNLI